MQLAPQEVQIDLDAGGESLDERYQSLTVRFSSSLKT
jgi:hypothetical protein